MSDLKIITHTSYTYETSDGREFDDLDEAGAWQKVLDSTSQLIMLTNRFKPTRDPECCFNLYVANSDLVETFNALQDNLGLAARISAPGYYYYDEVSDEFINIDKEIERLLEVKAKIDSTNT